jgi:hypothetical protein
MNQEITSVPAPPTGVIPTEVPLGLNTTTTPTGGPVNLFQNGISALAQSEGIYYGKFTINTTQVPGSEVFSHNTKWPLGDFPNRYNNAGNVFLVPWELLTSFYSKQCKIDWVIELVPVKVGDCRVILDVIFSYEDGWTVPLSQIVALGNDSAMIVLDSPEDNITVVPPMFWAQKQVQTDNSRAFRTGVPAINEFIQPAGIAMTTTSFRIRTPYQPNLLQPLSFEVLVFLHPIVRQTNGFAGKSAVSYEMPDPVSGIPKPYFLSRSQF